MGRISKAENTDSRYSNYSFINASDVVRKALEEIKNAGNDKDDVNTVLFIYRDDYYHPDAVNKNIAQIIIAKHREGKIGSIYLGWRPEFLRYLCIDEDDIDTSVNLYRYIDEELPFA